MIGLPRLPESGCARQSARAETGDHLLTLGPIIWWPYPLVTTARGCSSEQFWQLGIWPWLLRLALSREVKATVIGMRRWEGWMAVGGRPFRCLPAPATGPSCRLMDEVPSSSMESETRKGMNYSRLQRSRGKLRWKLVSILTCNSFVGVWC